MDTARTLAYARKHAGLTQRELASRTGVAQPTIARIERGAINPSVALFDRLLRACELQLEAMPLLGIGIDRSQIQRLLDLTPEERLRLLTRDAAGLARLLRVAELR